MEVPELISLVMKFPLIVVCYKLFTPKVLKKKKEEEEEEGEEREKKIEKTRPWSSPRVPA